MLTQPDHGLFKLSSNGVKLDFGSKFNSTKSLLRFVIDFDSCSLMLEVETLFDMLRGVVHTSLESNVDDKCFRHCTGDGKSQSRFIDKFNSDSFDANQNKGGNVRNLLLDKSNNFSSGC